MQDKRSYVYDVFQNVATGYDKANARISLGLHTKWKRKAIELLCEGMPEHPRILDVGCGTGDMLLLLQEAVPSARLVGLDFSPNMLDQARVRCAHMPNVELVQGDAQDLPFGEGDFDGVSIAFALRNTTDYGRVLAEAHRVLKPGGHFMCIDSFVPASPLVRPFYHVYFSLVMPLLGGGVRHWRQYRWLSSSTRQFVSAKQLCDLMRDAGFANVMCRTFMFGACACVRGETPS